MLFRRHPKRAVRRSDVTAFIDEGSEIEGKYTFSGTVMLNGRLKGEIVTNDHLIIGEKGVVNASVRAGVVMINGELVGNVQASERVELRGNARVFGDVEAPVVVIEEGVFFEGHCRMTRAPGGGGPARPRGVLHPGPVGHPPQALSPAGRRPRALLAAALLLASMPAAAEAQRAPWPAGAGRHRDALDRLYESVTRPQRPPLRRLAPRERVWAPARHVRVPGVDGPCSSPRTGKSDCRPARSTCPRWWESDPAACPCTFRPARARPPSGGTPPRSPSE